MNKYVCVRQKEAADCSAACLASICNYFGKKYSLEKTKQYIDVKKEGVSIAEIVHASIKIGFEAKGIKYKGEEISEFINNPIIAHIKLGKECHYVVLYEIRHGKATIADPAAGVISIPLIDFMNIWTRYGVILKPTNAFYVENKELNTVVPKILDMIHEYRKNIWVLVIQSFGVAILEIIGSYFYKGIIDYVYVKNSYYVLVCFLLVMLAINMFKSILNYIRNKTKIILGKKIGLKLMCRYLSDIMKFPMEYFDRKEAGDIINRFKDCFVVRELLSNVSISLFFDAIIVFISLIVLGIINSNLAIIIILFESIFAIVYNKYSKKIKDSSIKTKIYDADLVESMIAMVDGIETVKACRAEVFFEKINIDKINLLLNENAEKDRQVGKYNLWTQIIDSVLSIFVIGLLTAELLMQNITIGELVALNMLMSCILNSQRSIVGVIPFIQEGIVSAERIFEYDYVHDNTQIRNDEWKNGDIVFDNVSFGYNNRKILDDFSIIISQNRKIGIKGESGIGKTTLIKLLMGYYDTYDGSISVGDHEIRNISKKLISDNMFIIPQKTSIFKGTLYENITLFNNHLSKEIVYDSCRKAGLDRFIKNNNCGLDYMIESGGKNISKGEAQRIALARFFIQNSNVLILDEATCNLDEEVEKNFMDTIYAIKNKTIIIISHNKENLLLCDQCVEIINGKAVIAS